MLENSPNAGMLAASATMGLGAGFALATWWNKRPAATLGRLASRPSYTPGQVPTVPFGFGAKTHVFDPASLASCYNLMISTVTPRPIALVSSRNPKTGIDNVSPFSYFGAVGHDPPMVAIGFCRAGGNKKDSLVNILESKEFAVNIISEWYLDAANQSCGNYPSNVDEFVESGLTKGEDCEVVKAPRVKEAAVTYECVLDHVHTITNASGKETTEIVLAKVVRFHVDDQVLVDGFDPLKPNVDTMKLKPIGRLGGNIYTTLGDTADVPRPKL